MGSLFHVVLLKGKPAEVTGSLDLPHTYTYINDFGEVLAILGEQEDALGQAWHLPNAETLTHEATQANSSVMPLCKSKHLGQTRVAARNTAPSSAR